ncbi:MAG: AAA family ATPase, partial [Acinetobacter sp.]|nr:AAA family ATPase [Acinetobacter sp.]
MSNIIKPSATYEQAIAIDNARLGKSFKVIAYAGTGKTTTLQMISDAMPQRRGMYLAFNKAIASEAQTKFHGNVDCRTFHSLAFRSVPRGVTDKLRLPRLSPSFIAKEYRLEPITLRRMMGGRYEKYVLMPSRLASLVANAVSHFCSTSSQYPAPRHLQAPSWLHPDDIDSLQKHLYPAIERRWLESIDPNHQAG